MYTLTWTQDGAINNVRINGWDNAMTMCRIMEKSNRDSPGSNPIFNITIVRMRDNFNLTP